MHEDSLPENWPVMRRFFLVVAALFFMADTQQSVAQSRTPSPAAKSKLTAESKLAKEAGSADASSAEAGVERADAWFEREDQWHGFSRYHFRIADRDAYLVTPAEALPGRPWIWRARFPGYHDEMDVALVGQGFHLAYLDVANQFGAPAVIEDAKAFYDELIRDHELSSKPVMEGVSRGGLFVYNWATRYPNLVSGIYCDTPVLDFGSWPAGRGDGVGSAAAWKACLQAYGMTESEANAYKQQPVHKAAAIAEAKIPLLHIVSENDDVVPPKENTYRMRDAIRAHGHDLTVISVPEGTEKSNGHHFDHPEPDRVIAFFRGCVEDAPNEASESETKSKGDADRS
ncbi:MAG: alpha/beta hydrolase family protein [Rubripirellula sp.]